MTLTPDIAGHTQTKLRIMGDESVDAPSPVVVLLSCYMTGSTEGRNLGIAGYSHDFVARAFVPLLERYGEVRAVVDPRRNLQTEVDRVIAERRRPLHFSVLPLQDVGLGERVAKMRRGCRMFCGWFSSATAARRESRQSSRSRGRIFLPKRYPKCWRKCGAR